MSIFSYKSYSNSNKPKKLVFFLHGYNSCIEDLEPSIDILKQHVKDCLFIVPSSSMVCERNNLKKQWFALTDIDPERKRRKIETPTDEIIEMYNKTSSRISKVAKDVNLLISEIQKEYNISDKNTYVMGFSQGAMLAIYVSLTRDNEIAGAFSFAGTICGKDSLEKEIKSYPNVYLFHGTSDLFVQYKTLEYTKNWLDKHDISWEAIEYDDIEHYLIDDEMYDAIEIIKRKAS